MNTKYVILIMCSIALFLVMVLAFDVLRDYSNARQFCRDQGYNFANDGYGYNCYIIHEHIMYRDTIGVKKGVVYYD